MFAGAGEDFLSWCRNVIPAGGRYVAHGDDDGLFSGKFDNGLPNHVGRQSRTPWGIDTEDDRSDALLVTHFIESRHQAAIRNDAIATAAVLHIAFGHNDRDFLFPGGLF